MTSTRIIHKRMNKNESEKVIEMYLKSIIETPRTQYRRIDVKPRLKHYPPIEHKELDLKDYFNKRLGK